MNRRVDPTDPARPSVGWLVLVAIVFLVMNGLPAVASYLEMRWPDLALGGILFIALFLAGGFVRATDGSRDRILALNWVLLLIYLIHQFEEHGVDLFGRIYYFHAYANRVLETRGLELTPLAILRINTLLIWFAFLLAVWGGRRFAWPGLAAAGLVLTNGLVHIGIAVVRGEYNPGLATSIVLFLPISLFYFRSVRAECSLGSGAVAAAIAFGICGHAVLPVLIATDAPLLPLGLLAILPLLANVIALRVRT